MRSGIRLILVVVLVGDFWRLEEILMKKWKTGLVAAALLVSLSVGGTVFADTNVIARQDGVKVFVGANSQSNVLSRISFENERAYVIANNSETAPQESNVALITFNRYMTAEEVDEIVKDLSNFKVKEIFLGIPEIDGRAVIGKVSAGTIAERIESNFNEMLKDETNREMQQELLSYQNDAKVFAITVETTNNQIAEMSQMDFVDFVDAYDYPEAEAIAQRKNVSVSYIAVPEKPDSAK